MTAMVLLLLLLGVMAAVLLLARAGSLVEKPSSALERGGSTSCAERLWWPRIEPPIPRAGNYPRRTTPS